MPPKRTANKTPKPKPTDYLPTPPGAVAKHGEFTKITFARANFLHEVTERVVDLIRAEKEPILGREGCVVLSDALVMLATNTPTSHDTAEIVSKIREAMTKAGVKTTRPRAARVQARPHADIPTYIAFGPRRVSLGGAGHSILDYVGQDVTVKSIIRQDKGKFGPIYKLTLANDEQIIVVENSIAGGQLMEGFQRGDFEEMSASEPIVLPVVSAGTGSKGQPLAKFG